MPLRRAMRARFANKSLMTNRRCPNPRNATPKLGAAVNAHTLLSAAVAYLFR
jgi:hypothetical protein